MTNKNSGGNDPKVKCPACDASHVYNILGVDFYECQICLNRFTVKLETSAERALRDGQKIRRG